MNVEEHLEERRQLVDRRLAEYFPPDRASRDTLHKAICYSLLDGGKRIRPLLALSAAEAVGGRAAQVLPLACAIEMIHTYSLIHDDLPAMDDDQLRRGKPTCHVAFGEGVAILAGDALLAEAFRVATDPASLRGLNHKRILAVVHAIAAAAGAHGMVAGQVADLEAEGKEPDLATVELIHVRKTGALILAAIRAGAIVAGARPSALRRLSRFGEYLGLAFQIVDDVLDAVGGPKITGKNRGGDHERRKATYAAVVGLAEAKRRAEELYREALQQISGFGRRADPLREIARSVVARAGLG